MEAKRSWGRKCGKEIKTYQDLKLICTELVVVVDDSVMGRSGGSFNALMRHHEEVKAMIHGHTSIDYRSRLHIGRLRANLRFRLWKRIEPKKMLEIVFS